MQRIQDTTTSAAAAASSSVSAPAGTTAAAGNDLAPFNIPAEYAHQPVTMVLPEVEVQQQGGRQEGAGGGGTARQEGA